MDLHGGENTGVSKGIALSVVIPAYNEAARIRRTLEATVEYLEARCPAYEILVVDDGSHDETTPVVEAFAAEHPTSHGRIAALRYEPNRGKGHAVRYGVLRAGGERILFMDADLATPIEELEKLEAALDTATHTEYAIGSRPLRESQLLVRQPWFREMCGRLFNKVVQVTATPGIQDTQCGFKLLTRSAAREIFSRCVLDGFSFDVEALFLACKLGYRIAEVPVRWAHQEGAAAFATRGRYLRQGLLMLRDIFRIRQLHRGIRPVAAAVAAGTPYPPA